MGGGCCRARASPASISGWGSNLGQTAVAARRSCSRQTWVLCCSRRRRSSSSSSSSSCRLRSLLAAPPPPQGWGENDRGVSYTFGPDSVTEFLQKHDLDLICRAHQVGAAVHACGQGWGPRGSGGDSSCVCIAPRAPLSHSEMNILDLTFHS